MSHPAKYLNAHQSNGDSLFGLVLAQAFTGMVYGDFAACSCDAGRTLSAIHEDCYDRERTNGRRMYVLGERKCLAGDFTRTASPTAPAWAAQPTFGYYGRAFSVAAP